MSNQLRVATCQLLVSNQSTSCKSEHVERQEGTRLASHRDQVVTYAYSITQQSSLLKSSWVGSLATKKTIHRNKGHPRYACHRSSWGVSLRLGYCGQLLAGVLQASFFCTKGAGGMSLSPSLSFRGVVASDSPAFLLINNLRTYFGSSANFESSADEWVSHVEEKMRDLRQIFDERRASPYDVDIHGNTLIHVSRPIIQIGYLPPIATSRS